MKPVTSNFFARCGLLCLLMPAAQAQQQCLHEQHPFAYPDSRPQEQTDQYHGTKVADPYRWLEDANSKETADWVQAQNKFTQQYLSTVPQRAAITQRLQKLWNFERYLPPKYEGKRYFFSLNNGLQNQYAIYTMRNLREEPKLLLDPNKMSADGTIALDEDVQAISPDGKYFAYGYSQSGSDWNEWKIRDIETGKDLPDHLKWIKFSKVGWAQDSKGFYYGRFDEPKDKTKRYADVNYFHKLYYHKLGTDQSQDVLIYDNPQEKEWSFEGKAATGGRYLVITVSQGTDRRSRIHIKDLRNKDAAVLKLFDAFDAEYEYTDNVGDLFFFRTSNQAARGRMVAVDLRAPDKVLEIVPERSETLQHASLIGGHLVLQYLKDARAQVMQYDLKGKLVREVALPGLGTVKGFEGGQHDRQVFYRFTNYNTPGALYAYDIKSGKSTLYRAPKLDFNFADYETRQVFYTSRDGTRVPMFISAKKGIKLDGNNPTILYGYGGFNISLTPSYTTSVAAWMEMGGVYAVANLRGGGEYGQAWHEAGTKLKKQNVFDDFIAAAQWLQENKYTSPQKLAIAGGSNGGLLVGATMVQRPDLFAAALPAVGVLDMLRYHKFTIGWGWASDYGTADNEQEFKALLAYSPLHNVKPNTCYPATMITTGDHDDRVVPAHSFKFAAALQAAQGGKVPTLIRIETKAGHGAGKPTNKQIEEAADKYAFLYKVLQMGKAE